MFHCRSPSIRINRLHERWFCVIYNDKHSTFQRILDRDKSVSLHSCNLKGTPLGILADIFNSRRSTNYSLHCQEQSIRPIVISLCNETETTSYLGSKTWELLPLEMKEKESLSAFKSIIKICNPCLYRLCKSSGCCWDRVHLMYDFLQVSICMVKIHKIPENMKIFDKLSPELQII